MEARPEEQALRQGLLAIEVEMGNMPATQPTAEQVGALNGALVQLPGLTPYLVGLADLLAAVEATPSVDVLRDTWNDVKTKLAAVPSYSEVQPTLQAYANVQLSLPVPPTALLSGAQTLLGKLADVPTFVAAGKADITRVHDATRQDTDTLLLALFGEELEGYTKQCAAAASKAIHPMPLLTGRACSTPSCAGCRR